MKKKMQSINRNRLFQRGYKFGRNQVDYCLISYVLKNKSNQIRYGITTSKKIGKAVQRNRAKRLIKEAFRQILREYPALGETSVDIIFVARIKTTTVKMQQVKKIMLKQLKKENLI